MICFETLVETLLLKENDPTAATPPNTTPANDPGLSQIQATSLQNFLKSGPVYQAITTKFNEKYNKTNTFPMISQEELKQLASIVADKSLRSTKGSQFFPKLEITYPLLDVLAELAIVFKRGGEVATNDKPKEADDKLSAFYANLEKTKSNIPLDYQPTNPWAQTVKQDYYSKQRGSTGQIRLSELPKDLSIYGTIKHLLNLRQQATAFKFPKEKIPNPKQYIADIFLKPNFYIRGEKAVPSDKTMQELYDETTSDMLVGVSTAAYELFKQQALSIVEVDEATKKPKLKNEEQAYANYIGALSDKAVPFKWSDYTQQTNENLNVFNFNKIFTSLYASLILEDTAQSPYRDHTTGKQGVVWDVKFNLNSGQIEMSERIPEKEKNRKGRNVRSPRIFQVPIEELVKFIQTKWPNSIDKQNIKNFASAVKPPLDPKSDEAIARYMEYAIESQDDNKFSTETIAFHAFLKVAIGTKGKMLPGAPGQARFFETGPTTDLFLYSLGNVEKFQREVPPAGVLYEKLNGLADFIKKKTDVDWMGAMTKATTALRGLADASPNLGGGGLTG